LLLRGLLDGGWVEKKLLGGREIGGKEKARLERLEEELPTEWRNGTRARLAGAAQCA
jgi:hypothetical protein